MSLIDYIWKVYCIKMSAINSTQAHSQEFQLLKPESEAIQRSDDVFVSIDDWDIAKNKESEEQEMTIGIVIEEQTFIVLEKKEAFQKFTATLWEQFVSKQQKDIAQQICCQHKHIYQPRSRLTQSQKNAIINMSSNDIQVRKCFWSIANYNQTIEQDFILKQKSDQESRQQMLTVLSYQLTECQIKSLKQNVLKIHKIVKSMGEQRCNSLEAQRIWMYEKQIMQWIYDSLIRYAIEDQQVKYCKGLQYICLGIVVTYPQFNPYKYSQLLHHLLYVNGFRELFYEGSPRFFKQLQRIRETLREDLPELYWKIEQSEGDFKKLFVSYFRSCLIYKVTNPEIIRKIFELLFIEGIPAMKAIILRILEIKKDTFISNTLFLQNLSTQIILSYFDCKQNIRQRLQRLYTI